MASVNGTAWYLAHQMLRDQPALAILPVPLPTERLADIHDGTLISRFGYSIKVPWKPVTQERSFKQIAAIFFGDDRFLFFDPASQPDSLKIWNEDPRQATSMRLVLGSNTVSAHYQFLRAEATASPTDVSLFKSQRSNARATVLFVNKGLMLIGKASAMYSIDTGSLRGFQSGNPVVDQTIHLVLVDSKDRQFDFVLSQSKKGQQGTLTQEQINAVVASIQTPP